MLLRLNAQAAADNHTGAAAADAAWDADADTAAGAGTAAGAAAGAAAAGEAAGGGGLFARGGGVCAAAEPAQSRRKQKCH